MRGPFGLGWKRLKQWKAVLDEEGRTMGWRDWWHMTCEALRVIEEPVTSDTFKRRLRTCNKCPLYDKELRRCRPYTGSDYGCGCFVPYAAQSPSPCWLRQRDPNQGWD